MMWSVPRDWPGETAFVIAGGPSVASIDLSRLQGRRVVVINSSYVAYPNADYLVFTDLRWWRLHHSRVRATFRGRAVTVVPPRSALYDDDVLLLNRYRTRDRGGLGRAPTELAWWHTSVTSANDMLRWLGVARICYLGLDGVGEWHHAPHPVLWGTNPRRYHYHGLALESQVEALRNANVEALNLNPKSAHKMFPFATLDAVLGDVKQQGQLEMQFS